jgi:magnesium transporter
LAQSFPSSPVVTQSKPPRSFFVDENGATSHDLSLEEVNRVAGAGKGHLWVDIDNCVPEQVEFLKGINGLHPLAVEDALAYQSRPKIEEYDACIFVIIIGVRFHEKTPDPYDLETYDVCFFLGKHFVITVHAGPSNAIEEVGARYKKNPDLMARGSDRLAHAVMDASIDEYFPLLDKIDDFVDTLEQRVIVEGDQGAMQDIFAVKRLVLSLRKHLAPEREVFNILTNRPSALLSPESQVYFRDIYDHVLRNNDSIDTYRDLLSSVLDSYLTQVSNRLGRVSKGLAVVATVSLPFVVVSGMWGMNFSHIPLSNYPHAFWLMLAIQLGLGLMLFLALRLFKLL